MKWCLKWIAVVVCVISALFIVYLACLFIAWTFPLAIETKRLAGQPCSVIMTDVTSTDPDAREIAQRYVNHVVRHKLGMSAEDPVDIQVFNREVSNLTTFCNEHPWLTAKQFLEYQDSLQNRQNK